MLSKRIAALIMLAIIAVVGVGTVIHAAIKNPVPSTQIEPEEKQTDAQVLESFFKTNIPLKESLSNLGLTIRLKLGETKQGDIFIKDNYYIEDIGFPDTALTEDNLSGIMLFSSTNNVPTYTLIIPTKSAIRQESLSVPASLLFNQKRFIENTYTDLAGYVTSIDVYPKLFQKRSEDIFYHTDPSLTSLGSYYVYSVLIERLGVSSLREQNQFAARHLVQEFRGESYQQLPYQGVPADMITIYSYTGTREYKVTHQGGQYPYSYYSLYPEHLLQMGNTLEVFLGGNPTGDVEVITKGPYDKKLLIFGDDSMLSVIPFLAVHYSEVRLVDLSKMTPSQIQKLDINYYNQVLFAYSLDTFIHTDTPSRIKYN